MSEFCEACGNKFTFFRKKQTCALCKGEFCNNCSVQAGLSWGNFNEPMYGIFINNQKVTYRILGGTEFPKQYTLCIDCKNEIDRKMESFKEEANEKLNSVIITDKPWIPGYKILARLGYVESNKLYSLPSYGKSERDRVENYFRNEAVKLGANALINYHKTYIERMVEGPQTRSYRTPQDFMRINQPIPPKIIRIPIIRAEAVKIQKE